jgi:hypothetical protein
MADLKFGHYTSKAETTAQSRCYAIPPRLPGAAGGVVLAPEFVPPPDATGGLVGEPIAELMGEHEDLSAVMSFMGKHIAEHGGAGGPGGNDFVAGELGDAAIGLRAERVCEHEEALRGTLFEGGGGLFFGAAMGVERGGTFEMRSGVAEPVTTNVVQMGKDGGDGASAATGGGRSWSAPGTRVEMSKEELIHGVVDGVGFEEDVADFGQGFVGLCEHGGSVKLSIARKIGSR